MLAPLGVISAAISTPLSRPLRCAPLARVVDAACSPFVGADAHIGPSLHTTCGASVGRGDHTPPPPRHPRRLPARPPCSRGRAPSRPVGKVRFRANFRWFGTLPHRVGADLCVRPETPPPRTRPRADTQVGPYKSSIYPPPNRAGTEPRPYRFHRNPPSTPEKRNAFPKTHKPILHSPFSIIHCPFPPASLP